MEPGSPGSCIDAEGVQKASVSVYLSELLFKAKLLLSCESLLSQSGEPFKNFHDMNPCGFV